LYAALDRLRIDGLVEVDREEVVDSRLRRYYRLTSDGTKVLAGEASRAQSNAAAALARLGRRDELAGGVA
jgi:DNA-binding PadR family transcriptional regulator